MEGSTGDHGSNGNGQSEAEAARTTNVNGVTVLVASKEELDYEWPFEPITKSIELCKVFNKGERLVCDCDPDEDPCGDGCINRMINIECGKGCPCGRACMNKRLRRGLFKKVEVFQTEKKGKGLLAKETIYPGDLVYEYCGELIDLDEFDHRTKKYAEEKRHHYYFMSLDSTTVIDATVKGSISRFINHSCDPNCETQKWTVAGKTRIGFFAVKEIADGEEITFDYKYERYGDLAQPCYCGSANCRGTLGGAKEPDAERRKSAGAAGKGDSMSSKLKKRAEKRIMAELRDKLTLICGKKAPQVLHDEHKVNDFLVLLKESSYSEAYHARLLDVLLRTPPTEICLRVFLAKRGLFLLRNILTNAIEANAPRLALKVLEVIDHLPIETENVVAQSHITDLLQGLTGAGVKPATTGSVAGGQVIDDDDDDDDATASTSTPVEGKRSSSEAASESGDLPMKRKKTVPPQSNSDSLAADNENEQEGAEPGVVEKAKDAISLFGEGFGGEIMDISNKLLEKFTTLASVWVIPQLGTASTHAGRRKFTTELKYRKLFQKVRLYRVESDFNVNIDVRPSAAALTLILTGDQPEAVFDGIVGLFGKWIEEEERRIAADREWQERRRSNSSPRKPSFNANNSNSSHNGGDRGMGSSTWSSQTTPFATSTTLASATDATAANLSTSTALPSSANAANSLPGQVPVDFVPESSERFYTEDLHPDWQEAQDPTTNRPYFYHSTDASKPPTWDKPVVDRSTTSVVEDSSKLVQAEDTAKDKLRKEIEKLREKAKEEERAKRKEDKTINSIKKRVGETIVKSLSKYRKKDVKYGHIKSDTDFKYLARKLTHSIVEKMVSRNSGTLEGLQFDDATKAKVKKFVYDSMKKCGPVYQRPTLSVTAVKKNVR